jgi:hypothetical protein
MGLIRTVIEIILNIARRLHPTKTHSNNRDRSEPRPVVVTGLLDLNKSWQPSKLLDLAVKAFNYKWSIEHEVNPVPLESKDDFLSLQSSALSVPWKLGLAQYHAAQSITAIPSILPSNASNRSSAAAVLSLAAMSGSEEGEPFEFAVLMTEAHAIAAAQALHSIIDILADVIYIALRLNEKGSIPERRRNLHNVSQLAKDKQLSAESETILASKVFRYLTAYVNTTKHRRLVNHRFTEELVEPKRFGLRFLPFRYEFSDNDVKMFPSEWVDEFLKESLSFVSEAATKIGSRLETLLS